MRKELIERLEKIEQSFGLPPRWPSVLVAMHHLDQERRDGLAKDERIVLDWYQCQFPEVGIFWARERVTTNPTDPGRVCRPGQCLQDVMAELKLECDRQPDNTCETCRPGEYPDWVEWPPGLEFGR